MRLMVTVGQEMSAHCMRVLPGPSRSERVRGDHRASSSRGPRWGRDPRPPARWVARRSRGPAADTPRDRGDRCSSSNARRSPCPVGTSPPATRAARHLSRDEIPIGRLEGGKALIHEMEGRVCDRPRTHGPEMAHTYGWAARWLRKEAGHVQGPGVEDALTPGLRVRQQPHPRRTSRGIGLAARWPWPVRHGTPSRGVVDVALQALVAEHRHGRTPQNLRTGEGMGDLQIWDEVQTEIAGEADTELRRAEMTRLSSAGRHQESLSYMPSVGAGRVRYGTGPSRRSTGEGERRLWACLMAGRESMCPTCGRQPFTETSRWCICTSTSTTGSSLRRHPSGTATAVPIGAYLAV